MINAFLLTSSWQDSTDSTELTFWWHTPIGPVRQKVLQDSVCFIDRKHLQRAQDCAATLNWPVKIRPVALQSFAAEQAAACYMPSAYVYRWRDLMAEQNIVCREVDIRPTDRYLMERFIYGSAVLEGQLQQNASGGSFSELTDARIKEEERTR